MMFIVALYLPWCKHLAAQEGVEPRLFAGNLKCVSRDPGVLLHAARCTTGYVRLVGQEPASSKCVLMSTSRVVRICGSDEGGTWTVKLDVRELGGHLDTNSSWLVCDSGFSGLVGYFTSRLTMAWMPIMGELTVFSVYFCHTEEWTERNQQLLEALSFENRRCTRLWIVAGDFNMEPEIFGQYATLARLLGVLVKPAAPTFRHRASVRCFDCFVVHCSCTAPSRKSWESVTLLGQRRRRAWAGAVLRDG